MSVEPTGEIVDVYWTVNVNVLIIRCPNGHGFGHRADRRHVRCPRCSYKDDLYNLRERYVAHGFGKLKA